MIPTIVFSQEKKYDIDLIKSTLACEDKHDDHSHSFLFSDHESKFVRYNPVSLSLGSLMWLYQKIVSPQFSSSCLYHPSCSSYSMNLISDFGIIRGIIFTSDRLMRCNRLALMDFRSWEADPGSGKIPETTSYYRLNE